MCYVKNIYCKTSTKRNANHLNFCSDIGCIYVRFGVFYKIVVQKIKYMSEHNQNISTLFIIDSKYIFNWIQVSHAFLYEIWICLLMFLLQLQFLYLRVSVFAYSVSQWFAVEKCTTLIYCCAKHVYAHVFNIPIALCPLLHFIFDRCDKTP